MSTACFAIHPKKLTYLSINRGAPPNEPKEYYVRKLSADKRLFQTMFGLRQDQRKTLKATARRKRVPGAEIVRRALDSYFARESKGEIL